MRVGVSNSIKDCVVFKEELEPAQIHTHGDDKEQESDREGESAPGQGDALTEPAGESAGSAGNKNEQDSEDTGKDRQREQPSGDKLPGGKSKQIKVERLAEDGVSGTAARGCGCGRPVPEQRQGRPLRLYGCAGGE